MKIHRIAIHALRFITVTALICVVQLETTQAQAPQGKPVTIRGKISAIEKDSLKVTTSAGEVLVKLPDNVRVGGVEAAKLSDITAGNYVGATSLNKPTAI